MAKTKTSPRTHANHRIHAKCTSRPNYPNLNPLTVFIFIKTYCVLAALLCLTTGNYINALVWVGLAVFTQIIQKGTRK